MHLNTLHISRLDSTIAPQQRSQPAMAPLCSAPPDASPAHGNPAGAHACHPQLPVPLLAARSLQSHVLRAPAYLLLPAQRAGHRADLPVAHGAQQGERRGAGRRHGGWCPGGAPVTGALVCCVCVVLQPCHVTSIHAQHLTASHGMVWPGVPVTKDREHPADHNTTARHEALWANCHHPPR